MKKFSKLCPCALALVLALILICQFTPFWTHTDGETTESVSISSYIWFPEDHKSTTEFLSGNIGHNYDINQIVLPTVLVLILSVVGMILCLVKPRTPWSGLAGLVCGLSGLWGILFQPAMRLGTVWGWHMLLYTLALILGIFMLCTILLKKKA